MWATSWAERGCLPDRLVRVGIRRLIRKRLRELGASSESEQAAWIDSLRRGPIAESADVANAQHYELSPQFFAAVLGPRLKYSCCYWPNPDSTLAGAEEAMLAITCERAAIEDGMAILDLGCGWGALTNWIGERYPRCSVLALSNSKLQREFIEAECQRRGLPNVQALSADINHWEPARSFDRIVSVEMFEHVRNWELLLERVADWLAPRGELFLQIFCHRHYSYPYEVRERGDWMARHFFTGGIMPSDGLIYSFQRRLQVAGHWRLSGRHYQRTLEAWLAKMDANRVRVDAALRGSDDGTVALCRNRWRLFFLACSELFGWGGGEEWNVSQYLLSSQGGR